MKNSHGENILHIHRIRCEIKLIHIFVARKYRANNHLLPFKLELLFLPHPKKVFLLQKLSPLSFLCSKSFSGFRVVWWLQAPFHSSPGLRHLTPPCSANSPSTRTGPTGNSQFPSTPSTCPISGVFTSATAWQINNASFIQLELSSKVSDVWYPST